MKHFMTIARLMLLFLCIQSIAAAQALKQLPSFVKIHDIANNGKLLQQAIPTKGKVMLIFYDPGCGHCQKLGASLSKAYATLPPVQIYFVTMNDKEYVDSYLNMYAPALKGKKNVSFWKDPGVEFIERFMPKEYPATYIFDAGSKTLIKDFQGESDVQKIVPSLR
ncbi:TlpA family protein disulfide reductase [Sphingobacterium psychroaquaticum]|uniref:Thioredoxin domain-containing protein n=1 Tax=Sphingobacterium psychroaquaticum TaxID=561061 RepID=A0A1X7KU40_9SPHI|nr:protein disulfide isomerase family protein [Sphingobacterium psychroaquaticum]SMG45075.1 hypothetical protein SAMN05660862_3246 [Sphingobacterium psychroaquaticum]